MYVELACLDKTSTADDTRKHVFAASELALNGVVVLPPYITEARQYVPDMVLAAPIDYPYGTMDTKIREHAVLSALRKGANTVDLVLNHTMVVNKRLEAMLDDIETCQKICYENRAALRIMLEYRIYDNSKLFLDTLDMLELIGVEYVLPATGLRVDNFTDSLMASRGMTQRNNLKIIMNGGIFTKEQYEIVKKAGIYGIRFTSIPLVQNIFGV